MCVYACKCVLPDEDTSCRDDVCMISDCESNCELNRSTEEKMIERVIEGGGERQVEGITVCLLRLAYTQAMPGLEHRG